MLVDAETVEVIEVQCPSQKNDDVFWKKAPPRTISSGHAIYLASLAAAYRPAVDPQATRIPEMMLPL
jgi:hypothetical protein